MTATAPATAHGLKLAKAPPRWLFFALFTISGFSGLIYESIWSHYLKLFLGHAAYAQSLVLMIFMGGLAFGSWLAAHNAERWRNPILAYAIVEGAIGIVALVFHNLYVGVSDSFFFSILPAVDNAAVGGVLKWMAASALIFPQSVLLGMTFPLMSAGIIRRYPGHPGGSLAMLYFTNSIGAAIGVLASGFWLIRLVGLPGTIFVAGALNITLALVVWLIVKVDPEPPAAARSDSTGPSAAEPDPLAALFFFAAAVTGAASFIYEIGWIRMLSLVLGSTTHSFELMLSAFITGLAFGGLWVKRRIDTIQDPVRFSGWVQVLMGTVAIMTVPVYVLTFDWMAALLTALNMTDQGYALFTVLSHGIALVVMVPTTFLAGMTLPLFTHVLMRGREGEKAIGRVYSANTLGAIVGVLFAVHIGMPLLGLKTLIGLGALLDIGLGLALLHRSAATAGGTMQLRHIAPAFVLGAASLAIVAVGVDLDPRRLGSGVYRYRSAVMDDHTTPVYYHDGKTATVTLLARNGSLIIATNGKPDASIQMDPQRQPSSDEVTMIMAAAVPLAYQPDAKSVANIGLGSGLTTHTLLADPGVESVDTVEIEPSMVAAARGFGEKVARTFGDQRSRIHIDDAKSFFSLENRAYDVIISEPSNPWVSGVANLFSREFYRNVRTYLTDDGLFVQWLQMYEFTDTLVLSILKALSENFSDYAIYSTDDDNFLVVAKPEGRLAEPRFEHVLQGSLGAELDHVGLRTRDDFLIRRLADKTSIDTVLALSHAPTNSDYYPYVDLNAGKARFKTEMSTLLLEFSLSALPVLEMVGIAKPNFGRVTLQQYLPRGSAIELAHIARAAVTQDAEPARPISASLDEALTTLRLLRRTCDAAVADDTWEQPLHVLALSTLPYLNPEAARETLAAAVPSACAASLTESAHGWLDLYAAVAARDAQRIASEAERLLSKGEATDLPRRRYLTAAAMLGHLASGQPKQALDIWNEYRVEEHPEQAPGDTHLLVALALERAQTSPKHRSTPQ